MTGRRARLSSPMTAGSPYAKPMAQALLEAGLLEAGEVIAVVRVRPGDRTEGPTVDLALGTADPPHPELTPLVVADALAHCARIMRAYYSC